MKDDKKRKALLAELNLLAEMMKRHEWAAFGQKEAEEEEQTEARLDSEVSGSLETSERE